MSTKSKKNTKKTSPKKKSAQNKGQTKGQNTKKTKKSPERKAAGKLPSRQQEVVDVLAALTKGGYMAPTGSIRESVNAAFDREATRIHGTLYTMWQKGLVELVEGENGIHYWYLADGVDKKVSKKLNADKLIVSDDRVAIMHKYD